MYTILGFILGTILGSFAKATADRSLDGKSFWGRSFCPSCKRNLRWYDLFPILSYLIDLLRKDPVGCYHQLKERIKNFRYKIENGQALNKAGITNYTRFLKSV